MKNYLSLMRQVKTQGNDRVDRTGVGIRSIFGAQMRFDLRQGFPLVTTKNCRFVSIVEELLWFLRGETQVQKLQAKGVRIWDAWADENGELGPIYGRQWRAWRSADGEIDQIAQVMKSLKEDPYSRRHIVSAWNCGELHRMALPPCHTLFQFYVSNEQALSCQLYQRSCDVFLGLPFNIASYSLLVHMMAQQLGYQVGDFVWSGGDVHIYHNHFEQVELQLSREAELRPLPQIELRKAASIFDYVYEDFTLLNYHPHPRIAAPIAV